MSKFASFLVGMGGGYIKARDKEYERERQAKEDAWREEQQGRQRADWSKADKLESDLTAAAAPRTTMEGVMTEGAGSKVFNQDPVQAGLMAKTLSDEAEMRGMAPATSGAGTGVVADGAKRGHQIVTGPVDTAKLNSPEEVAARTAAAYRTNARPMEAMQHEATARRMADEQRARIKLLEKEGVADAMAALRANNPDGALAAFQKSGSMKLPEGARFTQVDGTDIFTNKPGKVWSIVGADGATLLPDVGAHVAKFLGIEGQLAIDKDIRASAAAEAKAALDQKKLDILQQQANARDRQVDAMAYRMAGGGGGGARSGDGGSSAPSVGLKERRDMLSDLAKMLPQPDGIDPKATQDALTSNARTMERADAVFSLNAKFGSVLTAPQVLTAQRLAQVPANVKLMRDNETGQTYQTVTVSGQQVIVGLATEAKKKPEEGPKPSTEKPAAKKPLVYDADLKAVVDAMAAPPKPVVVGPGSIDHMRRAFQKSNAIN